MAQDFEPAGSLTVPVAFLVVAAAPVAAAISGVLAIYDPARRTRWITMAVIAALVIVVWVPFLFFTEPRLESVTSRPG